MRKSKFRRAIAVIGASLALGSATLALPAQAQPSAPTPPAQVRVIVEKAFRGTLSDADRAVLVDSYPEIAAVVPDLSKTEVGETVWPAAVVKSGPSAQVLATTRCNTYTGWNTYKSLLGFTIYKFTHKATVCSNGTKVTSHSSPTYTISQADPTVENWSIVDRSVSGVNTAKSTSRIQVKVQQCVVKVGCFANHYPTGTIVGKANNTADISTTVR